MKKPFIPTIEIFLVILFIAGCSGYGKLRVQTGLGGELSLNDLKENWKDYHIYYTGVGPNDPSAVLFDPKGDARRIQKDRWKNIADSYLLEQVIGWIEDTKFMPKLHKILGPDNQVYGYLYSAWENNVVIKSKGEKVVKVSVSEVPPLFYGGP